MPDVNFFPGLTAVALLGLTLIDSVSGLGIGFGFGTESAVSAFVRLVFVFTDHVDTSQLSLLKLIVIRRGGTSSRDIHLHPRSIRPATYSYSLLALGTPRPTPTSGLCVTSRRI